MDITYSIDGVSLDDPKGRWALASDNHYTQAPAPRFVTTQNLGSSGGTIFSANQYDTTEFALKIHVTSFTKTGTEGGYNQLQSNLDFIRTLLSTGTLITRVKGGITAQQFYALTANLAVEGSSSHHALVTAVIGLAYPAWEWPFASYSSQTPLTATPATIKIPGNYASAPSRYVRIFITGPMTSFTVTSAKGSTLKVDKALPAPGGSTGSTWAINIPDWTTSGYLPNDYEASTGIGGFSLQPTPTFVNGEAGTEYSFTMSAEGSGPTTSTQVSIRRSWL